MMGKKNKTEKFSLPQGHRNNRFGPSWADTNGEGEEICMTKKQRIADMTKSIRSHLKSLKVRILKDEIKEGSVFIQDGKIRRLRQDRGNGKLKLESRNKTVYHGQQPMSVEERKQLMRNIEKDETLKPRMPRCDDERLSKMKKKQDREKMKISKLIEKRKKRLIDKLSRLDRYQQALRKLGFDGRTPTPT